MTKWVRRSSPGGGRRSLGPSTRRPPFIPGHVGSRAPSTSPTCRRMTVGITQARSVDSLTAPPAPWGMLNLPSGLSSGSEDTAPPLLPYEEPLRRFLSDGAVGPVGQGTDVDPPNQALGPRGLCLRVIRPRLRRRPCPGDRTATRTLPDQGRISVESPGGFRAFPRVSARDGSRPPSTAGQSP